MKDFVTDLYIDNINETAEAENLGILNEVYFGRTKEITTIHNELDSFRNAHMKDYYNVGINSDPQLLKINRMFEKMFGFGTFCIHIINQPLVNGFTLPIDYRLDVNPYGTAARKDLIVDKNSYRFDPKYQYACIVCVYSGAMFNPAFTTDEIMACILHEIGHNFFAAINRNNGVLADSYKSISLILWIINALSGSIDPSILAQTNSVNKFVLDLDKKARENKTTLATIMDVGFIVKNYIATIERAGLALINIATFNLLSAVFKVVITARKAVNPLNYYTLYINYRNERVADNFPTMYGYGEANASFLRKVEESGNEPSKVMSTIKTLPVIGTLFNFVDLGPTIVLTALDPHPVGISRANDQLKLLKNELSKTKMDPKMKKTIQADIAGIEKELNKYTDATKGIKDPDLFRHVYNRWLYEKFGSEAIKDKILDDKTKFEEYDKEFYSKL